MYKVSCSKSRFVGILLNECDDGNDSYDDDDDDVLGVYTTVVASSTAVSDPGSARRLGNASIGLSIAGIIVTVVIVIVVVAVAVSSAASHCEYTYYGTCYRYKEYVGIFGYCSGVKRDDYCYYN